MFRSQTPGIYAPRFAEVFRNYCADKRGVAAIEFAMIAAPFFFMIFGLLELCLIFIMTSVLEHGASEAARSIRTGEAQNNGFTAATFKQKVCDELFGLLDCGGKLKLDVQKFDDFAGINLGSPIDNDNELNVPENFIPGQASEIVVVRVFYTWDLITPVLSLPLVNLSNNRRLLQSTVAFRNEPFMTTT